MKLGVRDGGMAGVVDVGTADAIVLLQVTKESKTVNARLSIVSRLWK